MERAVQLLLLLLGLINSSVSGQDIPTLVPPTSFDPVSDAKILNDALSGIGTKEGDIISVLCNRGFDQRSIVTDTYYQNHGNLLLDLEDDLSGNFLALTTLLTYNKSEFLSIVFHDVITPFSLNEPAMTEIIISRTNEELTEMRSTYAGYYGVQLIAAIESETSGALRDLYVLIVEGSRDEGVEVDATLVAKDVKDLYDAGEGSITTNENVFVNILAKRNWLHIRAVADEYDAAHGSLEAAIVSEFNNIDAENALCSIIRYSRNKGSYFAVRFSLALQGLGTSDKDLNRLTISRCETDLGNIKIEYETLYRIPLSDDIKSETSGSYQDALLELLG